MDEDEDYLSQLTSQPGGYEAGPEEETYKDTSSVGGLGQASLAETYMNKSSAPIVTPEDVQRADLHLQQVNDSLIRRQQILTAANNPAAGPSRSALLAFAGGLGGGGASGGFGTDMARGARAEAPYVRAQELLHQQAQDKLDQLRLNTSKIESQRQHGLLMAQALGQYRQTHRGDELAKFGLTVDENGNYARLPVPGNNGVNSIRVGDQLTPAEIKNHGMAPGTIATWTNDGSVKIAHSPGGESMVIDHIDESGNPVYVPKVQELTPTQRNVVQSTKLEAEKIIPHINSLLRRIDDGTVSNAALGPGGVAEGAANITAGHIPGQKLIAPEDMRFRHDVDILNTSDLEKNFSRNPARPSDKAAKDVKDFLPNLGMLESVPNARSKLNDLREHVLDNYRDSLTKLNVPPDEIESKVKDLSQKIQTMNSPLNAPPAKGKKLPSKVGGSQWPRTVSLNGKTATVSNQSELDEATSEGWK